MLASNKIDTLPLIIYLPSVITELIIGYALPGRPLAMMLFKTWGYTAMAQALQYASDFKLGHYMKIPPRQMFASQVISTMVAGTVQLGVQAWMFANIDNMCDPHHVDGFTVMIPSRRYIVLIWRPISVPTPRCSVLLLLSGELLARPGSSRQVKYISQSLDTLFSAAVLIHICSGLVYWFLGGALCPLAVYLISLRWPHSMIKYVNFPVIFGGISWIPPASAVNFVPWAIVGFIFNFVIRRRHFGWWSKYNCESSHDVRLSPRPVFVTDDFLDVLSAALDSGLAIGIILVYFCLQYPENNAIGLHNIQKWWGNTVFNNTADFASASLREIPPSGVG